jgi:hypothetical protein
MLGALLLVSSGVALRSPSPGGRAGGRAPDSEPRRAGVALDRKRDV